MATLQEQLKGYYMGQPATTTAAEPVRFKKGDIVSWSGREYTVASTAGDEVWFTTGTYLYADQCTLVASHEGEPAVPEWFRRQVAEAGPPAGWRVVPGQVFARVGSDGGQWFSYETIDPTGVDRQWTAFEVPPVPMSTVRGRIIVHADHRRLPDPYAPTIDSTGAAVLPVPETPPPLFPSNCLPRAKCFHCDGADVVDGYDSCIQCCSACKVAQAFARVCPGCGEDYTPDVDLSLTNEVGLPTMPTPRVHSIGDEAVREMMLGQPDRPQPGDVVSWEAYVGESDGKPVMAKHEGLVVRMSTILVMARRKVDGETVLTTVAVDRCTVVKKASEL